MVLLGLLSDLGFTFGFAFGFLLFVIDENSCLLVHFFNRCLSQCIRIRFCERHRRRGVSGSDIPWDHPQVTVSNSAKEGSLLLREFSGESSHKFLYYYVWTEMVRG